MRSIPCTQGTEAWFAARCGVLTASTFADATAVLTRASGEKKAGDPTAAADEVCAIVAIERISGVPYRKSFETAATREGHEQEPELRDAYQFRRGCFVDEAGFVTTDDGRFGYSTDGLVDDDGAIEGKTLVSSKRVVEFLADPEKFIAEFRAQCLGGLWITGRQWIDLVVWIPQLQSVGKHLHIFRIERDDDEINALETKLMAALRRIDAYEDFLRSVPTALASDDIPSHAPPWDAAPAPPVSAKAPATLPENLFA